MFLTEFLDSFFIGWYLNITMECIIYDVTNAPATKGLIIILRTFYSYVCSILILQFESVPQSWIPYVQGFSVVLYNSIFFLVSIVNFCLVASIF